MRDSIEKNPQTITQIRQKKTTMLYSLYKKEVVFFNTMEGKLIQPKHYKVWRSRITSTYNQHHTNTDDTCSSFVQHDVHDGLFQSIRGCKQTWWVQAWIILDIAVALIGKIHDGSYGCIVSY